MSRQYPELDDIAYLTDWAERKIIQMANEDRTVELHPNLTRDLHRILTHPI
ncbi:MAG: hypothetical protein ACOYB1_07965 [Limnohabitans sp.]